MANLYQEDTIGEPQCDRNGNPGKNLVKVPSLWTTSIPHPQDSGRCFTYKYSYCFCKNKHFSSLPVAEILQSCMHATYKLNIH